MNYFHELSISTQFPMCYNLLPHFTVKGQEFAVLKNCIDKALHDGRIRTFFISDHPAQPQDFSSLSLANSVIAAGGEPIVSLSLSSDNRNSVINKLQEYYQAGVRQFLLVSGDYPARTNKKPAKPVADIDSVQLLMLIADFPEKENIAKGCVVSPFKKFESEQVWQYEKLRHKIRVGADFIVTQLGYDMRKFDELLQFCALYKITAPLIANIFISDLQTADLIQTRAIPGVKMPAPLLRILLEEAPDHQGAIDRTSQILAVVKGLGYHGALIGNASSDFSQVEQVLDKTEAYQKNWQSLLGELDFSDPGSSSFYYFEKNNQTGLNMDKPGPVALKHFPSPLYSLSYFVDWLIYVPEGPLFKLSGRFCQFCSNRKFWYTFLWLLEFLSKRPLYGCKMCGDCTLYACGFLCYQSGCPKRLLNGPCGGSIDGYCEVVPEKKRCYWVKVYHNMKGARQHVSFVAPPIPASDRSLQRTSSWINFFMGKDHRKMKFEES